MKLAGDMGLHTCTIINCTIGIALIGFSLYLKMGLVRILGLYSLIVTILIVHEALFTVNTGPGAQLQIDEKSDLFRSGCHLRKGLDSAFDLALKYSDKVKYYKIFGERDSGTNLIERMLKLNFGLTKSKIAGTKHMYSFDACATVQGAIFEAERTRSRVLTIFMHRSPFAWLEAMYRNHHEIKINATETFISFISRTPFESFVLNTHRNDSYRKYESYKNIFELRRKKLACFEKVLLSDIGKNSSHIELISYDFLAKHQRDILCSLWIHHPLKPTRQSFAIVKGDARPWGQGQSINRKKIDMCDHPDALRQICSSIDWRQEELFGYTQPTQCQTKICDPFIIS